MNIIIALELIPFAKEDSRLACAQELAERLESSGHSTHMVRLPFPRSTETDLVQSFLSIRLVSLQNADRLLVMDPYIGALQHSFKIGWIFGSAPGSASSAADEQSTGFRKEITALMVADCQRFLLDHIADSTLIAQSIKDQGKPMHIVNRTKVNVVSEEEWAQIIQVIAA